MKRMVVPVSGALVGAIVTLDRRSDVGLVTQLTQQLRALIASGRLAAGGLLPSTRTLAADLAVSRNTISYAFEQLASEGYLKLSRGRRPAVATQLDDCALVPDPAPRRDIVRMPGLSRWASQLVSTDWPMSYQAPMRPLRAGQGDVREFPHAVWARCLRRNVLRRSRAHDGAINRLRLRHELKEYLQANRGVRADADQIFILPTAQAALSLVAAILIAPGDRVLVEDPGYPGAASAFRAAGAGIVGAMLDDQGMLYPGDARPPKVIFTTPSHQHPTGRLMSVGRRLELISAAQRGESWIVEDDYDGELHYDGRPVPALQGLDPQARVLYVGTFSKAMTPEIRVGYLVAPAPLAQTIEIAQRHMGLIAAVDVQEALADFIADGHFLSHIRKVRRIYRARRDHLAGALERQLSDVLAVEIPPGGMQLVARLRDGRADSAVVERLADSGVHVRSLSSLALDGRSEHGLLLGFAAWRESEISAAVRVMAASLTVGRPIAQAPRARSRANLGRTQARS